MIIPSILEAYLSNSRIGEPVKLDFEGIKLNCPNKYKDYLKAIYGDNYMTLPPIEQRLPHQYEIVSLGEWW